MSGHLPRAVRSAAELSKWIYHPSTDLREGFSLQKLVVKDCAGGQYSQLAIVWEPAIESVFVVWAGTEAKITDILQDASFVPMPCGEFGECHSGFLALAARDRAALMQDEVVKELSAFLSMQGVHHVIFTGHSLGGAVAAVAVAHFKFNQWLCPTETMLPKLCAITFGSPMVFKDVPIGECRSLLRSSHLNFIFRNDLVPRLPGLSKFIKERAASISLDMVRSRTDTWFGGSIVRRLVAPAASAGLDRFFQTLEGIGLEAFRHESTVVQLLPDGIQLADPADLCKFNGEDAGSLLHDHRMDGYLDAVQAGTIATDFTLPRMRSEVTCISQLSLPVRQLYKLAKEESLDLTDNVVATLEETYIARMQIVHSYLYTPGAGLRTFVVDTTHQLEQIKADTLAAASRNTKAHLVLGALAVGSAAASVACPLALLGTAFFAAGKCTQDLELFKDLQSFRDLSEEQLARVKGMFEKMRAVCETARFSARGIEDSIKSAAELRELGELLSEDVTHGPLTKKEWLSLAKKRVEEATRDVDWKRVSELVVLLYCRQRQKHANQSPMTAQDVERQGHQIHNLYEAAAPDGDPTAGPIVSGIVNEILLAGSDEGSVQAVALADQASFLGTFSPKMLELKEDLVSPLTEIDEEMARIFADIQMYDDSKANSLRNDRRHEKFTKSCKKCRDNASQYLAVTVVQMHVAASAHSDGGVLARFSARDFAGTALVERFAGETLTSVAAEVRRGEPDQATMLQALVGLAESAHYHVIEPHVQAGALPEDPAPLIASLEEFRQLTAASLRSEVPELQTDWCIAPSCVSGLVAGGLRAAGCTVAQQVLSCVTAVAVAGTVACEIWTLVKKGQRCAQVGRDLHDLEGWIRKLSDPALLHHLECWDQSFADFKALLKGEGRQIVYPAGFRAQAKSPGP